MVTEKNFSSSPTEQGQAKSNRMTVKQVAAYFGCSHFNVYRWIKTGMLPCQRTPSGRVAYIPREAVEKYQVQ